MLTPEEKEKRNNLVKQRPCKECANYRKDSYISCGSKCDFEHSGFKRVRQKKENN